MNDHWDLDHPFERLLVETKVTPDPNEVTWINPDLTPGETRKVITEYPARQVSFIPSTEQLVSFFGRHQQLSKTLSST